MPPRRATCLVGLSSPPCQPCRPPRPLRRMPTPRGEPAGRAQGSPVGVPATLSRRGCPCGMLSPSPHRTCCPTGRGHPAPRARQHRATAASRPLWSSRGRAGRVAVPGWVPWHPGSDARAPPCKVGSGHRRVGVGVSVTAQCHLLGLPVGCRGPRSPTRSGSRSRRPCQCEGCRGRLRPVFSLGKRGPFRK